MPRDHIEYSQPVGDQVAYTTCYMCACRCGIKVHLRDGYGDHAANERTFLSWVRTAIAVIAFGFVIEKFNLVSARRAQQVLSEARDCRGEIGIVRTALDDRLSLTSV
jgi:hypothetical protein